MPNRMLRDWTDSEKMNKLSVGAERFFVRLIMKADDFGRYYADPCLLRSFLYPRIIEKVKESDISKFLNECYINDLLVIYEVESKLYLEIKEFGQRLRTMKSKFPGPIVKNDGGAADSCPQPAADGGGSQTIVGSEEEERSRREKKKLEERREAAKPRPPIPDEFLGIVIYDAEQELLSNQIIFEAICIKTGKDPTSAKDALRKYHLWLVDKEQYPKGKKAVFAGFEKWLMNEKKYSNGTTHQRSVKTGTSNGIDPTVIERTGFGEL